MPNRFFLPFVCVVWFLVSCTEEGTRSASPPFLKEGDFILVEARGDSVMLGTDDPSAPALARPSMESRFTYDYYLGEREVTRGEYCALRGCGVSDSLAELPVTDVTFWDAVLYANAYSKSLGLDTAYAYSSAIYDQDRRCTYLDGFSSDLSRDAYRLPTEAEWTYAARPGWDPAGAGWTSGNSGYILHPGCVLARNGFGLCDMAGNVMEWTGDWMGAFSDTSVSDFAGAPGSESLGERVVKGGSYRNSAVNISLWSRGDIYAVTSSTHAGYVGFRLARGTVSNPSLYSAGYVSVVAGAADVSAGSLAGGYVSVVAGAADVRGLFGTFHAKLAFRDDETGNVAFVNFASSSPRAVEIADTLDCYHPDISPDGSKVAFSTKPEGISGTSVVYVRDLDASGSGLVRLGVASAAIPRWRVIGTDTSIVYVTSAAENSDEASWRSESTWEVPFGGGRFGSPRKLYGGSYNGGVSDDGTLAVSGARLLRANSGGKESLWYGGEQACNASLEPESPKRTLFLDFGGQGGRDFSGTSYAAHAMLLVSDSSGNLSEMVPSPSGYTFDHTEWVHGAPGYAVLTIVNGAGMHSRVAVISTGDSSLRVLAEGDELWHPCLWVGKALSSDAELDFDSAGVYLESEKKIVGENYSLRYKMELLWEYYDSVEVAIIGSSRTLAAVKPFSITSGFTVNFSHVPNDIYISEYFSSNYFLPLFSKLKVIVVSLDIDMWFKKKNDDWNTYYAQNKGYIYDQNHLFWKDGVPRGLLDATKLSWGLSETWRSRINDSLGYVYVASAGWGTTVEIDRDSINNDEEDRISDALAALENIISAANSYGVYVVGVILPLSPLYAETGAYGRYGLRRSRAVKLIETLKQIQSAYPNFKFMDENKYGSHDYTDEMAANWDHLSGIGANQFTARLDSLLKTLK
ncbi:MAG: TIGR02171 family protein [Fibrobacteraceae bacterium]